LIWRHCRYPRTLGLRTQDKNHLKECQTWSSAVDYHPLLASSPYRQEMAGFLHFWKDKQKTSPSATSSASSEDVEAATVQIRSKDSAAPVVEVGPIRPHTDAVDDHRVAFLDTFTPEEQKKIMRKIDYRILVTVGVIYLVKQARPPPARTK